MTSSSPHARRTGACCWGAAGWWPTARPPRCCRAGATSRRGPRGVARGRRCGAGADLVGAPAGGSVAVSWQAASGVVVTVAALGGMLWYERRRPPAKLVALVAALAALGVAARVLFAGIPNVQ